MTFKCKNCGGYMVFSPERQQMYCSFCEGLDCEYETGDKSLTTCASCGGEITVGQFVSASKCPFCGNYLIFDERVRNEFKPDEIIPFKLGKKQAVEAMEKEFKKRIFTPISFLSERTLGDMEGRYVPFFLYDFKARGVFNGTGTKVRRWREGNYDCTETSYYDVERVMDVDYDNVPADASEEMPDYKMDLVEPYQYEALTSFDPRYLSGFFGEIYNNTADAYAERAREKAKNSASQLLHDSLAGYASLNPTVDNVSLADGQIDFALFPVWVYDYKWGGKDYLFYVNGQNGKVIGETPISKRKVLLYALTFGGIIYAVMVMIILLLEVL